jgi:hypothetical protein
MARSTVPRMAEWLTPMSATQSMHATSSMQVSCRTSETREKWPARRGRLRQPWQRAGDHESGGCGDADGAQERVRAALDERVPDCMQQRTRQDDAMDTLMLAMGAVRSQCAKWSNECNA